MKPKIIIEIKGGVLQLVAANQDIQYVLVDWDNIEAGDEFPEEINWKPDVVTEDIENFLLTLIKN